MSVSGDNQSELDRSHLPKGKMPFPQPGMKQRHRIRVERYFGDSSCKDDQYG